MAEKHSSGPGELFNGEATSDAARGDFTAKGYGSYKAMRTVETKTRDLAGQRFGRLVAIEYKYAPGGKSRWLCRCDCGNECLKRASVLLRKKKPATSCGCYRVERLTEAARQANWKHGMHLSPEHATWAGMKDRCHNENSPGYQRYGARGIHVCEGWRTSFEAFFADMGKRPADKDSLDRIENHRGYDCGHCADCLARGATANCRWATAKEQGRNTSRTRMVEWRGQTKALQDWAEEVGLPFATLASRLRYGWPVELAMTTPKGVRPPGLDEQRRNVNLLARQKNRARSAVRTAVKRGEMTKPPRCEHPGCTETDVWAHHHKGYQCEYWLDVVWLCREHHRLAEGPVERLDESELEPYQPRKMTGEHSPRATITEEDVRMIRKRAAAGERQADIGKDYNLTRSAVGRIVRRQNWKHVE